MFFIGDIHGDYEVYSDWLDVFDLRPSIQVGDFGFGFNKDIPDSWAPQHKFLRGNHDDPSLCRLHPNYLGEFGVTLEGIFYVSGAASIDCINRIVNDLFHQDDPSYWSDEEIPEAAFEPIVKLYEKIKPKVVVSHDCPSEIRDILPAIKNSSPCRNRTSDGLLSAMFKVHAPDLWVFGHYHKSFDQVIKGTRFICLAELEVFEYD